MDKKQIRNSLSINEEIKENLQVQVFERIKSEFGIPEGVDLKIKLETDELEVKTFDLSDIFLGHEPVVRLKYRYNPDMTDILKHSSDFYDKTEFMNGFGGWDKNRPVEAAKLYANCFDLTAKVLEDIQENKPFYKRIIESSIKLRETSLDLEKELKNILETENKDKIQSMMAPIYKSIPLMEKSDVDDVFKKLDKSINSNPSNEKIMSFLVLNPINESTLQISEKYLKIVKGLDDKVKYQSSEAYGRSFKRISKKDVKNYLSNTSVDNDITQKIKEDLLSVGFSNNHKFEIKEIAELVENYSKTQDIKNFVKEIEKNGDKKTSSNRPRF